MGGSCQVPRKVLEDLSLKHFDRKVSTLSVGMRLLCSKNCLLCYSIILLNVSFYSLGSSHYAHLC